MLRHNFLLTYRNFLRYKSSFFINLVGLSTGLACALVIYLWVNDELNIDRFHEKNSQLFQILTTHPSGDGIDTWWEGPVPLAPSLAEEMPEVEYAVASSGVDNNYTISYGDHHFSAAGQMADKNYFKIFSYELVQGERGKVLADKSSIVISERLALKLFNTTENILGKTVEWEVRQYKKQFSISGVFKDVPASSSDQFDFVASFEIFKDILGGYANWGNHHAKVCLLTRDLAALLFPDGNPIGHPVRVGEMRFTVIGVFEERVTTFGQSEIQRESVVIAFPLLKYYAGTDFVKVLYAQANRPEDVSSVTHQVEAVMQTRHRAAASYRVQNLTSLLIAAQRMCT